MGVDGLTLSRLKAVEPHEQLPAPEEIDLGRLGRLEPGGVTHGSEKGVRLVRHWSPVT